MKQLILVVFSMTLLAFNLFAQDKEQNFAKIAEFLALGEKTVIATTSFDDQLGYHVYSNCSGETENLSEIVRKEMIRYRIRPIKCDNLWLCFFLRASCINSSDIIAYDIEAGFYLSREAYGARHVVFIGDFSKVVGIKPSRKFFDRGSVKSLIEEKLSLYVDAHLYYDILNPD